MFEPLTSSFNGPISTRVTPAVGTALHRAAAASTIAVACWLVTELEERALIDVVVNLPLRPVDGLADDAGIEVACAGDVLWDRPRDAPRGARTVVARDRKWSGSRTATRSEAHSGQLHGSNGMHANLPKGGFAACARPGRFGDS